MKALNKRGYVLPIVSRLRASAEHTLLTEENSFTLGKAAYEAAELIADMFEALENLRNSATNYVGDIPGIDEADSAIAKALGETA